MLFGWNVGLRGETARGKAGVVPRTVGHERAVRVGMDGSEAREAEGRVPYPASGAADVPRLGPYTGSPSDS